MTNLVDGIRKIFEKKKAINGSPSNDIICLQRHQYNKRGPPLLQNHSKKKENSSDTAAAGKKDGERKREEGVIR